MQLNKTIIIGNITANVEARPVGETCVANFTVASNTTFKGRDGKAQEETAFIPATVWGKTAELLASRPRKGEQVLVEGRLVTRQWEKDGQKHSRLDLRVERLQFVRGARDKDAENGAPEPVGSRNGPPDEDVPF